MKRVMIFVVALLALAAAAAADFGSVVSSFRLSGTSMPYVTGIIKHSPRNPVYYGALYSTGPDYLLQYNESGSIIGSYILEGCLAPADMDDWSDVRKISVLDVGRRELLEYVPTTGSFIGSRPVPSNTRGFAVLGWRWCSFIAVGTWVYQYDRNWSIVSSFNTGMDIGAIAATPFFRNREWATVIVAPRGRGYFNCYYVSTGSFAASFTVPGSGTRGADCMTIYTAPNQIDYFCSRVTARGMYLYKIDIEGYSKIAPASLGRVKALFR